MYYTAEEILEKFKITRPYQKECVNYKGKTRNGTYYTEIISKKILENLDKFNIDPYVEKVKKDFSYKRDDLKTIDTKSEKGLCRFWYLNGFDEEILNDIGTPIEYELNIVEGNKTNVDLVSYDKNNNILYLIEVKGKIANNLYDTEETLLRCALEIKTYFDSLKDKKNEILTGIKNSRRCKVGIFNEDECKMKMAIIVPENSVAANQYGNQSFPYINELIQKWEIDVKIFKNREQKLNAN